MGLPRLLYAFARLDGEKTALEVGQDHMMLAPRDPTSLAALSFPDLFRSGNLYLRVPQVRVERKLGGGLTVMGGIVAPIAGDFNEDFYQFVPPAGAGERSKMPGVQGHFGYKSGDDETRQFAIGFSGHYGQERVANVNEDSWAGAVDFNVAGRAHRRGRRVLLRREHRSVRRVDQSDREVDRRLGGSALQDDGAFLGQRRLRHRSPSRWRVHHGGAAREPDRSSATSSSS